ncbi:hypothetical protein AB0C15_29825 [Micromonospora sp. NPDC048835]|uniref:hypothetical protein n=1 Tax=Micromonospora sp. NPDC048835 TaxID=3155147 RepID=UPI0034037925
MDVRLKWPAASIVIPDAHDRGLHYLEKLIRDAESEPGGSGGRFKQADDIAAILLTVN